MGEGRLLPKPFPASPALGRKDSAKDRAPGPANTTTATYHGGTGTGGGKGTGWGESCFP